MGERIDEEGDYKKFCSHHRRQVVKPKKIKYKSLIPKGLYLYPNERILVPKR
jgi:hypothetical protein